MVGGIKSECPGGMRRNLQFQLDRTLGDHMKRVAFALSLLAAPAFAQPAQQEQPPSPQAQVFALQQQMALLQGQDANAIARAYDLATQLADAQSQITALQAQVKKQKAP
jgi:hypothetical protein